MKRSMGILLLLACNSAETVSDGGAGGTSTLSLVEIYARAGAVVGSCLPDDGIGRNVARFWDPLPAPHFGSQLGRQARCLATTGGGCQAVRACLGYEFTTGGSDCAANSCAGSVFTYCGHQGGRPLRGTFDCAKVGQSCDPRAFCSDGPALPCPANPDMRDCTKDGRGTVCKNGTLLKTARCADLGLTCQAGDCQGTGAACTGTFSGAEGQVYLPGLGCDGTRLRACVGGKEQMVDCAAQGEGQGFTCQSKDGQFFCGLAAECVPSESEKGTTTCEGSTVVFCNGGRLQRVDCTALGFTGCDVDPSKDHYGCVPGQVPRELP